jgi:hypothetical protein
MGTNVLLMAEADARWNAEEKKQIDRSGRLLMVVI